MSEKTDNNLRIASRVVTGIVLAAAAAKAYVDSRIPSPEKLNTSPTPTMGAGVEVVPPAPLNFDQAVDWESAPGEKGFARFDLMKDKLRVPGTTNHYRWDATKGFPDLEGYTKTIDKYGGVEYIPDPSWKPPVPDK